MRLTINKKSKPLKEVLECPTRDPDLISKRGIPYFFFPEWVRILNGKACRIKPIKRKPVPGQDPEVDLYMLAKSGSLSYIQGSIQQEFRKWHIDNQIDYILLGVDLEELLNTQHDK